MKYTNLTLAVLFTLFVAAAASAQQPTRQCTVGVENAPELRGLRLGMTLEQVKSRLPSLQVKPSRFGLTTASLDYTYPVAAKTAGLEGVQSISLEFVDEHLVKIGIMYSNSINWQTPRQFSERVAAALKLPDAWENGFNMRCEGFNVSVIPNYISMSEVQPYEIIRQRRAEYEEKERQGFQP
jgi:hypothetical protein